MLKAVRESGRLGRGGDRRGDRRRASSCSPAPKGIFTEPAGGTTVAVTKKLIEQGRIPRDESIVICVTGNGYKTLEAVDGAVEQPFTIGSRLADFDELYARLDDAPSKRARFSEETAPL